MEFAPDFLEFPRTENYGIGGNQHTTGHRRPGRWSSRWCSVVVTLCLTSTLRASEFRPVTMGTSLSRCERSLCRGQRLCCGRTAGGAVYGRTWSQLAPSSTLCTLWLQIAPTAGVALFISILQGPWPGPVQMIRKVRHATPRETSICAVCVWPENTAGCSINAEQVQISTDFGLVLTDFCML